MPHRNESSKPMVRIMIAGHRDLERAGLRVVLESVKGWRVAGEAGNGAAAIELAKRLIPDVAIVELDLPKPNGLRVIEKIQEVSPRTLTILVGPDADREVAGQAGRAGAHGFLTHSSPAADVLAEVRSALRRAGSAAEPFQVQAPPHLTARELDVIRLVAAGCSTAVTGQTLGISAKTVERHRYNIMRKMDLDSIVEVVHYALREHIIAL